MIRKSLLLSIFVVNLFCVQAISAKTKECLVKPSYDIIVDNESVLITNPTTRLAINNDGSMVLNNHTVNVKAATKIEAKEFQAYLRWQLPNFEQQAYRELGGVRSVFEKAINERLGNDSGLLKNLNSLYAQLTELLSHAITTKNDVTYFYYKPFNNLKKEGEAIGKKVFYKIISDSIFSFNVFKNYSAIKKIAKQEWKQQKTLLKSFDDDVCTLITDIDDKYNHLMSAVTL
ncbi:hypothetical protein RHO12_04190 [Orbus sturtevantii]|uniref:hypothetical protein n=1 Tax=Orbus sturtevantii TaxID=3074109 RepID=UPI00370D0B28